MRLVLAVLATVVMSALLLGCSAAAKTPPACQTAMAVAEYKRTHDTEPTPPPLSAEDQARLATKDKQARDYYIAKYGGTPDVGKGPCD